MITSTINMPYYASGPYYEVTIYDYTPYSEKYGHIEGLARVDAISGEFLAFHPSYPCCLP